MKNWQAKCAKFFDTNNLILDLKVCIEHRSITTDKKIEIEQEKEIMILKRA